MLEFLIQNWEQFIWTPIVGFVTWYFTKRNLQKAEEAKATADVTGAHLNNITANFEVYQNLINDLEARFKARIQELEEDLEKMKVINEDLRKAVSRQEKYIKKLLLTIEGYENTKK